MNKIVITSLFSLFLSLTVLQAAECCDVGGVRFPFSWEDRHQAPVIEAVHEYQGDTYLSLTNGSEVRLRPVYYYVMGWDKRDDNIYELFRRDFNSVAEIFALDAEVDCWKRPRTEWNKPYHRIDIVEGQPIQIILPPADSYSVESNPWSLPYYSKKYNLREQVELWSWSKLWDETYSTIPLNFYDTSVNLEPLRVNLYEHPHDSEFFRDPMPSSTSVCTLGHAHLIEADLLKLEDLVEVVEAGHLQFKYSQIHARVTNAATDSGEWQAWEVNDLILALYRIDGVYELLNMSKGGLSLEVYLSDPAYSDLRNYSIFEDLLPMGPT